MTGILIRLTAQCYFPTIRVLEVTMASLSAAVPESSSQLSDFSWQII